MSEARWNPGPPPTDGLNYVAADKDGVPCGVGTGRDYEHVDGIAAHYGPIPPYDPPPPAPVLPDKPTCFVATLDGVPVHGVYLAHRKANYRFVCWGDVDDHEILFRTSVKEFENFRWLDDESGNPLGSEGANG